MKKRFHIPWLIISLLMIVVGVVILFHPQGAILSMAFILGACILLSGLCSLVIYFYNYKYIDGSGWILADGILSTILGFFILCNQWVAALSLPYLFGLWILASGIGRVVHSIELHRLGIPQWGWLLSLGIFSIVAGIISFMDPVVGIIALTTLVGTFFLFYGCSSLWIWNYFRHLTRG